MTYQWEGECYHHGMGCEACLYGRYIADQREESATIQGVGGGAVEPDLTYGR